MQVGYILFLHTDMNSL